MQIPTGMLTNRLARSKEATNLLLNSNSRRHIPIRLDQQLRPCLHRKSDRRRLHCGSLAGHIEAATHWFPSRRFVMLSGLGLLIGNIGALTAQVPLRLPVENFNWRTIVIASGVVILLVVVLAWTFVRNDPSSQGYLSYAPAQIQSQGKTSMAKLGAGFKRIFEFRNSWLIFFAQGGLAGPIMTFTGLWGPPFLKARFGIPSTTAAAVMIVCWAGARVYGVEAFQTAFLLSVSWTLLSCVLSSLRQETGCRQSSVWGGPRADPLVSPLGFTPSQSTILSEQQTL